jgi:hypothetical protein
VQGSRDRTARSRARAFGFDEVLVLADVVTSQEQRILVDWAEEQRGEEHLLQNPVDALTRSTPYLAADGNRTLLTSGGHLSGLDTAPVWVPDAATTSEQVPEAFWTVRTRVIDRLRIGHLPDDPYKGSFLTSVTSGGDVHTHKDARLPIDGKECALYRCNVLVQRPEMGGMPVIEGTELDIPDRGMWAFHATENVHRATEVDGPVARVTLSFGFVVDPDPVWERPLVINPEVEPPLLHGVKAQLREAELDPARAASLDALLDQPGEFSVADVAGAIGLDPWLVWVEARRLQRVGLIQSLARDAPPEARVVVV